MGNEILENEILDSFETKQTNLPKDTSILVTGIVAIPFSLGIIGLLLSILTLINASAAMVAYRRNPTHYLQSSYKKVKAGKTCAIVSLSLFGLGIIIVLLLAAMGAF